MQGFLKIVSTIAILGIVIIAIMFILDIVSTEEVKDTLTKVLLVLAVVTLGGVGVSFMSKKAE